MNAGAIQVATFSLGFFWVAVTDGFLGGERDSLLGVQTGRHWQLTTLVSRRSEVRPRRSRSPVQTSRQC